MVRLKRLKRFHRSLKKNYQDEIEKKRISNGSIENFSNEIFYEIFDYLDGYDIYKAFENLNNRFDNLLNNKSFLMKIKYSSTSVIIDPHYKKYLQSNKHHLFSLEFSNEYILDEIINFSIINSSCHHLQSVNLDQISTLQLLILLFYFQSLPRLYSLKISLNDCYDHLGQIYQMVLHLPVLKYFKLEVCEYQEMNMNIPRATDGQISPIEYLVLEPWFTLNEIVDFLSYTPRLSHLYCSNIVEPDDQMDFDVLMKLTNLVHLNLTIIDLDFNDFEEFLLHCSGQLKSLHVKIQCSDRNYLDGHRWEKFISEKLFFLKDFSLCYNDWIYNDYQTDSYYSLINHFTSPFWIERKWILTISIENDEMFYLIRSRRELCGEKTSGAIIEIKNSFFLTRKNETFLEKIQSISQSIELTHLNAQFDQISVEIFIEILNLLPHLRSIEIFNVPSYDQLHKSSLDIQSVRQFLANNKLSKLILRNLFNFEQITLIIDLFPRLQYFTIDCPIHFNLPSILRYTLIKIHQNQTFHPLNLCLIAKDAEYDQLDTLKRMIDEENLLKDYRIHRQLNKFHLQWK